MKRKYPGKRDFFPLKNEYKYVYKIRSIRSKSTTIVNEKIHALF